MLTANGFSRLLRQVLWLTVAGSHLQAVGSRAAPPAYRWDALLFAFVCLSRSQPESQRRWRSQARRRLDAATICDAARAAERAASASLLNYNY